MSHVVDVRNSGGELVVIGDEIVLPQGNVATTNKNLGSIRYNPTTGNVEAFLSVSGGAGAWYALAIVTS